MFARRHVSLAQSADGWARVPTQEKTKLFKIHQFLLMSQGKTYNIEIQESVGGDFLAHADNTADPHDAIKSCGGATLTDCLAAMVQALENRTRA